MSPEVQHLLNLMEEEDWPGILHLAGRLLNRGGLTAQELASLNLCVCRAHLFQHQYLSGLPAGELARKLALDLGLWDLLGTTLIALAGGYVNTRSYQRALERCIEYLEFMPRFDQVRSREGDVWFILGRAQQALGHLDEATVAYHRAAVLLERGQSTHWAMSAIYRRIECLVERSGSSVLPLLSELRRLAPAHPVPGIAGMIVAVSRGKYLVSRGRLAAAVAVCTRALKACEGDHSQPVTDFKAILCLFVATTCQKLGNDKNALGYAIASRMHATRAQEYVTEFLAMELIYRLLAGGNHSALADLDREYLEMGLDLSRFIDSAYLSGSRT